jgi:hypothetical protein
VEPDEIYLVVDIDAPQAGVEGLPGALYRFNRTLGTLSRFAEDARFRDPQMAVFLPGGDLLLSDSDADPDETGRDTGAIFRIDGSTGAVKSAFSSELFVAPNALALAEDGTVYVTDRYARTGSGPGLGAVFQVDLERRECKVALGGDRLRAPAFVLIEADGALLLLDADVPTGVPGDEGVLFRSHPGSGELTVAGVLKGAISPLGMLREPEGTLLVFDANADPHHIGGPLGAVFRFDPESGETTLVVSSKPMRDPARGCLDRDGQVLFVDANADPEKRGPDAAGRGQNVTGGGAIFRLNRHTGELTVLLAPPEFVNPVSIARWPP